MDESTVNCERCGEEASEKGSLIKWPDGTRAVYCGKCSDPFHDAFVEDAGGSWELWWGWEKEEIELQKEISNRWFSVMHVMSRLGIFKPYLKWVEQILNYVSGIEEK